MGKVNITLPDRAPITAVTGRAPASTTREPQAYPEIPGRSTAALERIRAHRLYSARTSPAPARAGAVRCVPGPVPPPACADALAARRLRVPDLTPSKSRLGEVGNTTALLHE